MNNKHFLDSIGSIVSSLRHSSQQLFELLALVLFLVFFFTLYKKLTNLINGATRRVQAEIRNSIQPKFIEFSQSTNELIDLAVEIWRMKQRISKASDSLSENSKRSMENSIQKLYRYLERNDVELLDYFGQVYNDNLSSVEVVSVEKDKKVKKDTIVDMIEPGVLIKGKLVRKGQVIVATRN